MKTFFQLREELQQLDESLAASQKHMNKLADKEGHLDDPEHIGSHGHEHVYATHWGDGDDEATHYAVHNTKTNKVHKVPVEHNDEHLSKKEVEHSINVNDPKGHVSAGARKHIHNDHNDEYGS
jgi:hypothetical protein